MSGWEIVKRIDGKLFKASLTDPYTLIPVAEPKKFGFFKRLWLQYSPEWYKRRMRHKSHMAFLDRMRVPKDAQIREVFGTKGFIEAEKVLVMKQPPPESYFNDFDPTPMTKEQRQASFRKAAKAAFEQHRVDSNVFNIGNNE